MKLSIIIPTYNASATLRLTLESIATQIEQNCEVVLIDGLSTDDTLSILTGYSNRMAITIISEKDLGIYDAMNKGISRATGEWLYFMGADDQFGDETVLAGVFPFLTADNDIVYGDCTWYPEQVRESGDWTPEIFINQNINHQRIFYRKTLFEKYGGYNIKYTVAADHDLNVRFFCNDMIKTQYVPVNIAAYHSGGFSSNNFDEAFWKDWKTNILEKFSPYLSRAVIYASLGNYIRFLIRKKYFSNAIGLISRQFYYTRNARLLKAMMLYLVRGR